MPFAFESSPLGPIVIKPKVFPDERGSFAESFKSSDFRQAGIGLHFVQDNWVVSRKGVLRGLHYQLPPKAQGKLIYAITGRIWDVAVDVRKSSPTFKQWLAVELSEENQTGFYIPPGFAHGFAVLTESATVMYKMTDEYDNQLESGIIWNDPDLALPWPLQDPVLSARDQALPKLKDAKVFE